MNGADYASFCNDKYFKSLDGLRCVSILAVIFHHTASKFYPNIAILHLGHMGVHLFFAISGFLITTLFLREKDISNDISLKKFYMRRILRIFPIYYLIIAVYVVLVPIFKSPEDSKQFFHNLPYFLTYTSDWFTNYSQSHLTFYFAWSLAVEEQFYLFWPWFEKYLRGPWAVISMCMIILIVQLTDFGFFSAFFKSNDLIHIIIVNIAPAICFGVLLAHLLHNPRGFQIAAKVIGWRYSSAFAAFLLLFVMWWLGPSMFIIQFLMAVLVGSCAIREDHVLSPFLTQPVVRQAGKVSYGMYLMHMLVFNFILDAIAIPFSLNDPMFLFVSTSVFTFLMAQLSYNYFEGYFFRLKQKYVVLPAQ